MVELKRGEFTPISTSGKNAYRTGKELLLYAYAPSDFKQQRLSEEIVVGKTPNSPDQIVVGSYTAVQFISRAFNILDVVGDHTIDFRQMDIICTFRWDDEARKYVWPTDGAPYTNNLLTSFGLLNNIKDSAYSHDLHDYGVIPDVRRPLFLTPDYSTLIARYGPEALSIYWASILLHEWQHVLQSRQDLPTLSNWSERHAASSQGKFLLKMLNSGRLNKQSERVIVKNLQHISQAIQGFRHGISDAKHTDYHGSPIKDQNLHSEDFAFGY